MKSTKYDIFVSYRRSSFESAQTIATSLKNRGYKVFFDLESLRGGKFNEQLFQVIDSCQDFVLILSPGALDRCHDSEDWVRQEVMHALQSGKHIVPVMLTGFEWPRTMPEGMESLNLYHAVAPSSVEYYDESINKLCSFLKSIPLAKRRLNKTLKVCLYAIPSLLALWGILWACAKPYCNIVGLEVLNNFAYLDVISESNEDLSKSWTKFTTAMVSATRQSQIDDAISTMREDLSHQRSEMERLVHLQDSFRSVGPLQFLLLASHGINPLEIIAEPKSMYMEYENYIDQITSMTNYLEGGNFDPYSFGYFAEMHDYTRHTLTATYYDYIRVLQHFPSLIREQLTEVFDTFMAVPPQIVLGLSSSEYEKRTKAEMKKAEEFITRWEKEIDAQQLSLSHVENQVEAAEQFLDSLETASNMEIEARKSRIAAKQALVSAKEAELNEMEKENINLYNELKTQCTLKAEDGQWYKWGKIIKYASYLETMVKIRSEYAAKGVESHSTITPALLYSDLVTMLNDFKGYHPDCEVLAETAKAFYKEVSTGKRNCDGVFIVAIMEGKTHPHLAVGDIITSMKGVKFRTFEQMKEAKQNDGPATITYLRLDSGVLKEYALQDCDPTDILGCTSANND